jgi:hypothetical protein
MVCGCRADVENLNSHNEAELWHQNEERQQETKHVYELLENKIQLLQEVGFSIVSLSRFLLPCLLAFPFSLSTFLLQPIKGHFVIDLLTSVGLHSLSAVLLFPGIQASKE